MCIGNFVIINTYLWIEERVQAFVNLVISTGDHFRLRWNKQAVMAMVWQMFVPDKELLMFDFEYVHGGLPCQITAPGIIHI